MLWLTRRFRMQNFYPRPPRGGRHVTIRTSKSTNDFYPRPPRGGRRSSNYIYVISLRNFYPRPPRGGRQANIGNASRGMRISIHALREEGDSARSTPSTLRTVFLSTPSARRATALPAGVPASVRHFYPRPPRGGRQRERSRAVASALFLSTPSARRATK